jgi:hypothetical protein
VFEDSHSSCVACVFRLLARRDVPDALGTHQTRAHQDVEIPVPLEMPLRHSKDCSASTVSHASIC